ncbi:MAG TPA: hypothetical protein GXX54_05180 [Clostridiales bacterium]|nr:hypothetical protein [Clostridiales bacterium]
MNEYKARNLSLIIFSLEAIAALLLILRVLEDSIKRLSTAGSSPNPALIIILLVFLGLGILIILSAFFKPCFYFLIGLNIALCIYLIYLSLQSIGLLLLVLLVSIPSLTYFTAKAVCRF